VRFVALGQFVELGPSTSATALAGNGVVVTPAEILLGAAVAAFIMRVDGDTVVVPLT